MKIPFVIFLTLVIVWGQNIPYTKYSHPSIVHIGCVTSNSVPVDQFTTDRFGNKYKVGDYIPSSVQVIRRDGVDKDKLHVVTFNSDGSSAYTFNKTGRTTSFITTNPWNNSSESLINPAGPIRSNPEIK